MAHFKEIRAFIFVLITWQVFSLGSQQFCEKDEKTGLCKEGQEDEDGPCWYLEPEINATKNATEDVKGKEFGKLYLIDGVEVVLNPKLLISSA